MESATERTKLGVAQSLKSGEYDGVDIMRAWIWLREMDAVERKLAAYKQAVHESRWGGDEIYADALERRVAELLAQEGGKPHVNVGTLGHVDHGKTALTAALTKVGTQPQYREPTIEDAMEIYGIDNFDEADSDIACAELLDMLKQLNFYRKVQS